VNPAWEKASGFTSGKVINMKGVDLLKDINLDTNLKHAALLQNVLKTGTLQKTNLTWINAHGVTLHLSYILVPEYDACGKVTSVLSVGHDITELKRAEEEASRFNKELEQRVKWRTSELEQRNAQLDKMNRLFVGRELRMKELKEKIAQLEDHTNRKIINS
jgi:PAS domain S-box-containing protein